MGKRQSLQQMVFGKLDSHMQKNETGPLSYTIHKNTFKKDERPKCETVIHQNLEENRGSKLFDLDHNNIFLDMSPKTREIKQK